MWIYILYGNLNANTVEGSQCWREIDLIKHLESEHIANICWSIDQARSTAHAIHDNAEEDKASAYSGNKVKTIRISYTWSLNLEHTENMLGTSIWI